VDNSSINLSSVSPILNGLSDHNVQILTIKIIYATQQISFEPENRLIGKETIMNFHTLQQ
jgi:hypothetical protein